MMMLLTGCSWKREWTERSWEMTWPFYTRLIGFLKQGRECLPWWMMGLGEGDVKLGFWLFYDVALRGEMTWPSFSSCFIYFCLRLSKRENKLEFYSQTIWNLQLSPFIGCNNHKTWRNSVWSTWGPTPNMPRLRFTVRKPGSKYVLCTLVRVARQIKLILC